MNCLLCPRPARVFGVFLPFRSSDYGAPAGKQRQFHYALCQSCAAIENVRAIVEARIAADFKDRAWTL